MSKVETYQQEIRDAIEQLEKPYATVSFHGDAERVIISMDTADLAIAALRAQIEPGWIKVSERLPDLDQGVIIWAGYRDIAWIDWDTSKWTNGRDWFMYRQVTHWMPLPEPPRLDLTDSESTQSGAIRQECGDDE